MFRVLYYEKGFYATYEQPGNTAEEAVALFNDALPNAQPMFVVKVK